MNLLVWVYLMILCFFLWVLSVWVFHVFLSLKSAMRWWFLRFHVYNYSLLVGRIWYTFNASFLSNTHCIWGLVYDNGCCSYYLWGIYNLWVVEMMLTIQILYFFFGSGWDGWDPLLLIMIV